MNENILSGIIGGIIASGIVSFIILVVNKIIVPYIKVLLYKGIDIQGKWTGKVKYNNPTGSKTYSIKIK